MTYPAVSKMPVKLGLELMTTVGADRVNAKRECVDHVVEELNGVHLGVARIDPEGADAGGVVDGGVLVPVLLQLRAGDFRMDGL